LRWYQDLAHRKQFNYAMSRRQRSVILLILLLTAVFLIWLDKAYVSEQWLRAGSDPGPISGSNDFGKYHARFFKVVQVFDGDTLAIDEPDGQSQTTRIRLWGIDTPETGKGSDTEKMYYGDEAAVFVKNIIEGRQVTVYLDEKNNSRDKYYRLLAYLVLADGTVLNELLIKEGYAYSDERFKHSFLNKYAQLESIARRNNKGLWENVTRGQLPEWLQRERPKLLAE
jgi:endonuclease YncB( thermonuclease family)